MRLRTTLILLGIGVLGLAGVAPGDEVSWSRPTRVVPADGPDREARQPQVAVDGRGRIYVTFGVGDAIRCARSVDGGRTFAVATVGAVDALSLGMRRGPRVAVAGDAVVISAIGGREGKGRDGDLLAWRSTDGGVTWAGPARVNTVAGSAREGLHGMAAGPDGSVYGSWLDLRARRTEVYGARSRDGGATWEPDRLVYRSPDGSVCQCCHPSVAYGPDGTLGVMWRNQLRGARDLYLARSADGGATFGAAEKLGRGTWNLATCPMDGGAVALGTDGLVETAWMREGSVFAARPGEPERRLGPGVQGWTAIGPGGPYSVWIAARPGRLVTMVPGRPEPLTLADAANDPSVAAGPGGRGPVVAVWEGKSGAGLFACVLAPAGEGSGR